MQDDFSILIGDPISAYVGCGDGFLVGEAVGVGGVGGVGENVADRTISTKTPSDPTSEVVEYKGKSQIEAKKMP